MKNAKENFVRIVITLVFIALVQQPIFAQEEVKNMVYYVSINGNDNWSGTLAEPNTEGTDGPFATLQQARDAIRQFKAVEGLKNPVTVMVRGGTYYLSEPLVLTPEDSGSEECPITYTAFPGESPVVSGGRVISNWKQGEGELWTAHIPDVEAGQWYFRQLFVNGERRQRARLPNDDYFHVAGLVTSNQADAVNRMAFRYREGDIDKDWVNVHDVEIIKLSSWSSSRLPIAEVDEETNTVKFSEQCSRSPRRPFTWYGGRYYVENVYEGLDQPGEWYLNRKTGVLYYLPLPDEDMSTAEVIAPVTEQLVRLSGDLELGRPVEHIRLAGLTLYHTAWSIPDKGLTERQAQVDLNTAAIYAQGAVSCTLENIHLAHVGAHGIWFEKGCKNNRVVQCHIHDVGAGGVYLGAEQEHPESSHNIVDNNFIHHCCEVFQGAIIVWIGRSSYNTVTHNELCDSDYTGISVGWSWGFAPSSAHHNIIEYNHIHHCGHKIMSDFGGIYTLGIAPGTRLRYNLIHDMYNYPDISHGSGIYPDEGTTEMLIENNIVYNVYTSGFFQHYGRENIVRNNIFAFAETEGISRCREEDHISFYFRQNIVYSDHPRVLNRRWSNGNYEIDNNIYWNTSGEKLDFAGMSFEEWQAKGNDRNSIIADPQFKDPSSFDFGLNPGSPAQQIGFKPIDTSSIGLYGESEWVNAPQKIKHRLDGPLPPPPVPLQVNEDFEKIPANSDVAPLHITIHDERDRGAYIQVTDETAASGKHSLKLQDAPGLKHDYNPHFYYSPNHASGVTRCSFDMRIEEGVVMCHEWRDNAQPYNVGPSFWIRDGRLKVWDKTLLDLSVGEWMHFEVEAGLGETSTGTWNLTVTIPGQAVRHFADLKSGSDKWRSLNWLGFSSTATHKTVCYLDNIKIACIQ